MDEHFFKTTPSSIYLVKNDITLIGREVTFFKNNIILFFKRKYLMGILIQKLNFLNLPNNKIKVL